MGLYCSDAEVRGVDTLGVQKAPAAASYALHADAQCLPPREPPRAAAAQGGPAAGLCFTTFTPLHCTTPFLELLRKQEVVLQQLWTLFLETRNTQFFSVMAGWPEIS